MSIIPTKKRKSGPATLMTHARYDYKIKLPGAIRLLLGMFFFVLQIVLIALLAHYLQGKGFMIYVVFQLFSVFMALFIVGRNRGLSYTLAWSMMILALPFMGILMYLLWGSRSRFRRMEEKMNRPWARLEDWQPNAKESYAALDESQLPAGALQQLHYLAGKGFPAYRNSRSLYFSSGEAQFQQLFQDLEAAESFIFLEYFILAEGHLWSRMEEILIRKAAAGLDIRLMIDDFGSMAKAPLDLFTKLRKNGVKVVNFNPVLRYISRLYANYRNHQKICVVDGHTAWLGGTNLADEYVNLHQRFGYWKDTAIRLQGDIALGATLCFLLIWEAESETEEADGDYARFLPQPEQLAAFNRRCQLIHEAASQQLTEKKPTGIYVHYWDSPLNNPTNPAEAMYLSMINSAQRRLYITTPYFIVDEKMMSSLCRVAESGVDLRLITPGIPDKRHVFKVTRSNYGPLLKSGARVYEFTPGFIHSKMMMADDDRAIVGSINLDYRSLNLNFENAVFFYDPPVVEEIERDFMETLTSCRELSYEEWKKRSWRDKWMEPVLRVFSPLL